MPSSRDLTTLDNVKAYLGVKGTDSDALLGRLVTAMSNAFTQETGRIVLRQSVTEVLDGDDERVRWMGNRVVIELLYGPVIGDPVVVIDGITIPERASLTDAGWVLLDGYHLEIV